MMNKVRKLNRVRLGTYLVFGMLVIAGFGLLSCVVPGSVTTGKGPVVLTIISPTDGQTVSGNTAILDEKPWWETWIRDKNHNKIDDLIENIPTSQDTVIPIFIDYNRRPTGNDADLLSNFGINSEDVYVAKYIDTVCVDTFARTHIEELTKLPGVVMIELQPEIESCLNVACPAVKARNSIEYSPTTAWELGYTGQGINVALVDSGVDDTIHESLRGKFVGGADYTGPIALTDVNPDDNNGHGTHCAGIVMGTGGRSQQYMGVAPNASLVDVKVTGKAGAGLHHVEGIDWCIQHKTDYNISVISLSQGGTGNSDGQDRSSQEVNAAVDAGIVVVSVTGNDGLNEMEPLGAADKAITVGAIDDLNTITRTDDTIATFSNYGPRVSDNDADQYDELKPDVVAPGVNIYSAAHNTYGSYISESGTSMACPFVAGVAALMLNANLNLTPANIKEILHETAEPRGTPYNSQLSTKYNIYYGYGIVDAYGAVKRALDLKSGFMNGPTTTSSSYTQPFSAGFSLTRTNYTTTTDSLNMKIKVPSSWTIPTNIELESGTSLQATTSNTDPELEGDFWTFNATFAYTGVSTGIAELQPRVHFRSTTDAVDSVTYTFTTDYKLNGINGTTASCIVQSGGSPIQDLPDLAIASDDISFSPNNPQPGTSVTISAVVHNYGTVSANHAIANFTARTPTNTEIQVGSQEISVPAGESTTATATWTPSDQGTYTITVTLDPLNRIDEVNEANNIATKQITVSGTTQQPPVANLVVSPTEADIGTVINFDGSGSYDPDGQVTEYYFDFDYEDTYDTSNSGWITASTTSYTYTTAGRYICALKVRDDATLESDFAKVDLVITGGSGQTPPIAEAGADQEVMINAEVQFHGTGTDPDGTVNLYDWDFDGDGTYDWSSGSTGETTHVYLTAGDFHAVLRVTDDTGLTDTDSCTIKVRASTLPIVEITSPSANTVCSGIVQIEGYASDEDGTIQKVEVKIDSGNWLRATGTDSWNYYWDTNTVTDGSHTIYARSFDGTDYSDIDSVNVVVNIGIVMNPPSVKIRSPDDDETVSGLTTIRGTAEDLDGVVEKVEIRIDAGEWQLVKGTTTWSYDWDTMKFNDGTYTISARSYDGTAYSDVTSVSLIVQNHVPIQQNDTVVSQKGVSQWFWYILIAIAMIIILGTTLLGGSRKRREFY